MIGENDVEDGRLKSGGSYQLLKSNFRRTKVRI